MKWSATVPVHQSTNDKEYAGFSELFDEVTFDFDIEADTYEAAIEAAREIVAALIEELEQFKLTAVPDEVVVEKAIALDDWEGRPRLRLYKAERVKASGLDQDAVAAEEGQLSGAVWETPTDEEKPKSIVSLKKAARRVREEDNDALW